MKEFMKLKLLTTLMALASCIALNAMDKPFEFTPNADAQTLVKAAQQFDQQKSKYPSASAETLVTTIERNNPHYAEHMKIFMFLTFWHRYRQYGLWNEKIHCQGAFLSEILYDPSSIQAFLILVNHDSLLAERIFLAAARGNADRTMSFFIENRYAAHNPGIGGLALLTARQNMSKDVIRLLLETGLFNGLRTHVETATPVNAELISVVTTYNHSSVTPETNSRSRVREINGLPLYEFDNAAPQLLFTVNEKF
jgi:hypothetical protein